MVNSGGSVSTFVSEGDWVPISEAAIADDGTIPICIIQEGWSQNQRHYSESVLRAAARLYKTGTHNLWNHPGPLKLREQPSGDLNDIASVLSEDARYLDATDPGAFRGAGLYSRARPVSTYRDRIAELAKFIGLSHRVTGRQKFGTVDGRKGWIVEEILDPASDPKLPAITVDWVARPAAGGRALAESIEDFGTMTDEQIQEQVTEAVNAAVAPLNEQIETQTAEITRLKEENVTLRNEAVIAASTLILREELAGAGLPEAAAKRMETALTFSEGEFNAETYRSTVKQAVEAEKAYIAAVAGPQQRQQNPNPGVAFSEGTDALALVRELRAATGR